jgi:hypothetical protein
MYLLKIVILFISIIDYFKCEIKRIDDGIAAKMAEINGMSATPTRSNRSPTDV